MAMCSLPRQMDLALLYKCRYGKLPLANCSWVFGLDTQLQDIYVIRHRSSIMFYKREFFCAATNRFGKRFQCFCYRLSASWHRSTRCHGCTSCCYDFHLIWQRTSLSICTSSRFCYADWFCTAYGSSLCGKTRTKYDAYDVCHAYRYSIKKEKAIDQCSESSAYRG